jgi:CRISPR-associated endonuclease/helicase Cas3
MTEPPSFPAHHRKSDGAWQALPAHLFGVARLAATFADKVGLQRQGELLGLLHDLGKYSQAFRAYILSATEHLNPDEDEEWVDAAALKGKVDHSSAGAQFVWQGMGALDEKRAFAAQVMALCIASHHSGLIDCIDTDGEDQFSRRIRKATEKTHLTEAAQVADTEVLARARALLSDESLVEGLWLSFSKLKQFNQAPRTTSTRVLLQQVGLSVRMLFSCLIDADRLDTANFEHRREMPRADYPSWPVLVGRLERHLATFPASADSVNQQRALVSQACFEAASRPGGIYTLTVPTGGGKTLASLRFALHHAQRRGLDRVFYIVPYTSIIDQNAREVRSLLETDGAGERGRIVLEHHSNLTRDQQTWREKMLTEDWDSPIVFTTMVQFLEALFGAGTRGARRMHQLANAVVIFDEIQALPIKCVHLFNNAVNYLELCCNSTMVLCTATQPLLHRVDPKRGALRLAPNHELVSDVPELFNALRRVEVLDARRPGGWSFVNVADLAVRELHRAGSCLVIVNTKEAAKQIHRLCSAHTPEGVLFQLSTHMCPAHRKRKLGKKGEEDDRSIIGRLELGLPVLCISTQLIEAGVDVDFGAVVRSLSGLDSIAQAAGRCNRHGRRDLGQVHIVNLDEERLAGLHDIAEGQRVAERVLDDYRAEPGRFAAGLLGPDALAAHYNFYFFKRKDEMTYPVGKDARAGGTDNLLTQLSTNELGVNALRRGGGVPLAPLHHAFMSAAKAFKAIDAPTEAIVVPYTAEGRSLISDLHAAYDLSTQGELFRKAQQFSVNVFPQEFQKLLRSGATRAVGDEQARIYCLREPYYSDAFGLSTEVVANMENQVV